MNKIPLLVICGPTASGKTSLALELAKTFDGEIISADSMQLYKGMDIGTAKPTPQEMQEIPHHMIDILEPWQEFSVAEYASQARELIFDIHRRGKLPILVGGTGLYVQAIVDNIYFDDIPSDELLRDTLYLQAEQQGSLAVWEQLLLVDPSLANRLHPNNLGRIIRGIEVYTLTGKMLSVWQEESRMHPSPYDELIIGLNYHNRDDLYARINQRVDSMLEEGLVEEAKWFFSQEVSITAKQAIGYKELASYIAGEESLATAVERLKRESRRYAKRQLTWMRKEQRIHWFYLDIYEQEGTLFAATQELIRSWRLP